MECSIKDTGYGIPDNEKDKLFQAFGQSEEEWIQDVGAGDGSTFGGETKGIGLGLSTTKLLLEA